MAITILPQEKNFAQSLGTGLGQALSGLAENKIRQLQQQSAIKGLESLGFNPDQASSIAGLPPELQQLAVKQQLAAPQQQAYAQALSQLLGGGPLGQESTGGEGKLSPFSLPSGLTEKQATDLAKLGLKKQADIRKEEHQTQKEIDKETAEYYNEISKSARIAKENDKRLDRMQQLIEKGNFGIPAINSAIKSISKGIFGFGIDLSSLMTADAQEFEKLSADFIKGAKDLLGNKVTNDQLQAYMKTIPTLSQSAAGMQRLINSLKNANEAVKLRKKIGDQIIKENNGKRPRNFDAIIEEKIGPQLDELTQKFINAPFIGEKFLGGILRY